MTRRPPEAGFSLIETLVALTVIAAMAGLLFEAIATNARAAGRLEQKREAILLARSLLAQATVVASGDLAPAGRWRDLAWRTQRQTAERNARDEGATLENVRIEVTDAATGRPLASVRTLRLGR